MIDPPASDRPTSRELASWRKYLATGSVKRAAAELGVHEQTVKRHIAALRVRYDCETNAQLAVVLTRAGLS